MLLAAACSGDRGSGDSRGGGLPSTTAGDVLSGGAVRTEPDPSDATGFASRVWRVVGVVEGDVVQMPPPGVEATLLVEEGRISGSAGCNEYTGPVEMTGTSLRVGNLSITERACVDAVDWPAFLDTLTRARSLTQVGDGYVIDAFRNGAIVLQ